MRATELIRHRGRAQVESFAFSVVSQRQRDAGPNLGGEGSRAKGAKACPPKPQRRGIPHSYIVNHEIRVNP
jgi:hypothetical protein